jgi:hypothetical protein
MIELVFNYFERKVDMPFKSRTVPVILMKLRILDHRMELSDEDKSYYFYKEKGFEGELQFDALTEKLPNNSYILNDLQLKINNNECQIDSALTFYDTTKLFDVKNLEGEFIYYPDKLHKLSGKEKVYQNPLGQLNRFKILFHQQLELLGSKLPVEAYVIFINPNFTLFNAPPNLPIILPTQINSFMKKLSHKPDRLNSGHLRLAEQLKSLHLPELSKSSQLPTYSFGSMKKGMSCKICFHLGLVVNGGKADCLICGFVETVEAAVVRSVEEIRLLFPEMRITTNLVFEWCGVVGKKRISRILIKYFDMKGVSRWSYFE